MSASQVFVPAEAPRGAAAIRTLSEQMADPTVLIDFRPGFSASAWRELFGGPEGPEPVRVGLAILRAALEPNLWGGRLDAVEDETRPGIVWVRLHATGRAEDPQARRIARVIGMSGDRVNDGLLAATLHAWPRQTAMKTLQNGGGEG